METEKEVNILFNKNGNGFLSPKISLPVDWIKELGFNENDKKGIIEIKNKKIILRKK